MSLAYAIENAKKSGNKSEVIEEGIRAMTTPSEIEIREAYELATAEIDSKRREDQAEYSR